MKSLFYIWPGVSGKMLLLFLFVFIQIVAHGQITDAPEWKWQNPSPQGNSLNDVQFLDAQTGWAVGWFGTILKSTNGGTTWKSQDIVTNGHFKSVHFANSLSGWVVGTNGVIIKTNDGGNSWQAQTSGTTGTLSSLQFADAQTGWVVGDDGIILKTTNGGSNWLAQTSGTTFGLSTVHFTDSQTGWAVGLIGLILKTTNGGSSWQVQNSGTTSNLNSVHFPDSQNGWVVSDNGKILKTSNGGASWFSQSIASTYTIYSVHFATNQIGWIVDQAGIIRKTTNGGSSWQVQNAGTNNMALYSIHFVDALTGWAVGYNGIILKTTDGGSSWLSLKKGFDKTLLAVHFSNSLTGLAVGSDGCILKTSNGGNEWKPQISGTTQYLYAVRFVDAQTAWAAGLGGTILKTTNGGSNWQSQTSGVFTQLNSISFSDAQTGWICALSGTILKTSNGGSSWQNQNSGTSNDLNSVYFTDSQTGWAVGTNGTILKTTNGGANWLVQNSGTTRDLKSVFFTSPQTGWAVGYYSILKTTNGGNTWLSSITSIDPGSVHFTDNQTGWVTGTGSIGGSTIIKTTNGGGTWLPQNNGTTSGGFCAMSFTDALHGWVVGYNGDILTTATNNPINPQSEISMIEGRLFEKSAANCIPSPVSMQSRIVKATPGPYYGISNETGIYQLSLPLSNTTSNFILSAIPFGAYTYQSTVACPPGNAYSLSLGTQPDTLSGKDFGYEVPQCHILDVQIASNQRRRCFTNTTRIFYSNQGSSAAPDAYVLVEYPHWVRPLSASRSYTALSDSVWRFDIDTVSSGTSGSFTITDSVLCGNLDIFGLSQCTRATIFPSHNCQTGNWNGSSLSASGKCLGNGHVRLSLSNTGLADMLDSSSFRIYLDSILVFQKRVKLVQNDSIVLEVQANGKLVHMEADQVSNHPTQYSVVLNLEGCGLPNQSISKGFMTKFSLDPSPTSKTHCLPIQGAYDPNDKQAFPRGFTNQNIIPPNTQLEYLVRFQNTGNDTAFTVYVIDTLDTNLNPESIELGAASHSYQLSMQTVRSGKTFLRWQFDNILLPDSNTNLLKSNGFIQYRISPKPGLALGSKVRNHAEIYFDFNPPVITNQTLTTFDNVTYTDPGLNNNVTVLVPTGVPASVRKRMRLYPNPVTTSQLKIHFEETGRLTLFDAQGKEVWHSVSLQGDQTIPVHLRTGMYLARIVSASYSWTEKVVVE